MDDIYKECEVLCLKSGDLLIDPVNNSVGVLYKRTCFASEKPCSEDMYLWSVHWTKMEDTIMLLDITSQIEEYGLKMSIIIGLYDLIPSV